MKGATTAIAHANIAFAKYWGKREGFGNLPAVGSISLTLSELYTRTSLRFTGEPTPDRVELDGQPASEAFRQRVSAFLDRVREVSGRADGVEIKTTNSFPTGAGLASSASGFAALTLAATRAAGLALSDKELSQWARSGSGSAARSIFGGFARMHRGSTPDGADSYAEALPAGDGWDLRLIVAVTSEAAKSQSSTAGMNLTRDTSPYYRAWVEQSEPLMEQMVDAIEKREFERLGTLTEDSCLRMHGLMMSASPGVIYWLPASVALIHEVRALRANGTECYFTMDAGPQVKVLCQAADCDRVSGALQEVEGVKRLIVASPGPAAYIEETA